MRLRTLIAMCGLATIALTACATDRERYQIGDWEPVQTPDGLFPDLADQRSYATTVVSYNFRGGRDEMMDDMTSLFKTLAYFEYLVNDLRRGNDVPPHAVRKVIDARDKLRAIVKLPPETGSSEAINQLYSMSKFMAIANVKKAEEPEEIAARRRLLAQARSRVDGLLKQTRQIQEAGSEHLAATAKQGG